MSLGLNELILVVNKCLEILLLKSKSAFLGMCELKYLGICRYIYIYMHWWPRSSFGAGNGLVACSVPSHHLGHCWLLPIETSRTYFNDIWMHYFLLKKIHLKISLANIRYSVWAWCVLKDDMFNIKEIISNPEIRTTNCWLTSLRYQEMVFGVKIWLKIQVHSFSKML